MNLEEVPRNVVSASLLTRFAVERGASRDELLKNTGLEPETLDDPGAEILASQELMLVRNLIAQLGQSPGLGLDAGQCYHLSSYGIWGFALLSSPTLRALAEVVESYLALSYAFVRFSFRLDTDALRIVLDDRDIPEDLRQFLLERDFAAWANAWREVHPGGQVLRGVSLRGPRPSYSSRFAELCGVEPRFSSTENAIELDPAMFDLPLPQGNPMMARMCLDQCRHLLGRRQTRDGYSGRVRESLFQRVGDMPGLAVFAEELHLSERGLRRHLAAEGTSFRALRDEVLETLAEELLTSAHMKLEEVSTRLGFSEPASFIHAFKRWKGMSPNAFREKHRLNR